MKLILEELYETLERPHNFLQGHKELLEKHLRDENEFVQS